MSTDFKRLFANLKPNDERGSGKTYSTIYQLFGACLQGDRIAVVVTSNQRMASYLKREVQDMGQYNFGVTPEVSNSYNDVNFSYKGERSTIRILSRSDNRCREKILSLGRNVLVLYDE